MNSAVGRNDIEPTIVVVVEEHGSETRERNARRRNAHLDAAVIEVAAAPVEEQRALLPRQMREENIFGAIAVEVRDVDAHARFGDTIGINGGAADLRLVFERPVLLVDPELIG